MKRKMMILILGAFMLLNVSISAQTIYVDAINGKDINIGTKELPVQSLFKAADIANSDNEGGTLIKLLPGLYNLTDKITFNNKKYTVSNRLVIEAAILPDDASWSPYSMPVITSTASNSMNFGFQCCLGFNIEISHVTIRGLKFTGNANPNVFFYYPIGRGDMNLTDFVLSQCLFVGDREASPIQGGVSIHGDEIKVDHCIFNNCKNTVVYWVLDQGLTKKRINSKMTYCIVSGAYESAIWTVSPDENFEFHNNIIIKSRNVWMHGEKELDYKVSDCIFYDNELLYSKYTTTGEIESKDGFTEKNVKNIPVQLVSKENIMMTCRMAYDYLHAEQESEAAKLKAGLFINERRLSAYVKYHKILKDNGFDKAFEKLNQIKNVKLFFFEETKFNNEGYNYMLAEKPDEAIKIFRIITEKFPKSSNAFDSLAEAYLKKGDKKTAKMYYKKALELNPQNENATKMMKEL